MQKVLGKGKTNFNFKTSNILKMLVCCRLARKRDHLRFTSGDTRQVLYFAKGREKLDKEMDIAFIIRHVRILRYFLRTVLDKDQRVLLKLKSTEYIPSSDDERKAMKGEKKHKRKDLILQRYIENLQKKTLGKQDIRLLEVLGFHEALEIITEEKQKQIEREAIINTRAGLDGTVYAGDLADLKDDNDDEESRAAIINGLGGVGSIMSKT